MIKSCVGIGLFTSPVGFTEAGYLVSCGISFFVCYLTTYGMWIIASLTNEIEDLTHSAKRVLTYHDLGMACVTQKWQAFVKWTIILSCTCVNLAVVVANSANLADFFVTIIGGDTRMMKGGLCFVYVLILACTPEPEKIKIFAVPAFLTIVFIFIAMIVTNTIDFAEDNISGPPRNLTNWSELTVYLGIALYSYEAVATLFTVRNSMKEPKKCAPLCVWSFTTVGAMFMIMGCSFYSVYGQTFTNAVWEKFPWETSKFFYL